ncbi:MAG: LytTR family transcriptional regulator DNA-binding domain-containing protein, partial [Oscillospiraceae bacterium]|nr:LytTR family transcriptional regulator DNA-binding domain-containing protein [Oscillospiraceae bacterium]
LVAMLRIHQQKLVGLLNGEQHLLDVKDILYIDTADKRTFLYTGTAVYESALRLYELEDGLRELDFLRAGRSVIVNFRRIRSIRPELGGRLLVTMDNGEQVYVSRQYAGEMKGKLRELERSILK